MKSQRLAVYLAGAMALSSLSSEAVMLGGLDPADAPDVFVTDTANTFMVISNQFTYTTTTAETIDLSLSTFDYQSNANAGAAATPFLAIQGAGDIHDTANFDVIWVGDSLANDVPGTDVSSPLGIGTLELPGDAIVVGGYFASAGGTLSPVSAVFATGDPTDVLVIAQSTIDVDNDIIVTGTNWSTNPAVTSREYHYQINLEQGGVDSDGDGLPDEWEEDNDLDPDDNGENPNNNGVPGDPVNGALGDPDGDLLNNLGEYQNRCDPRDDDSDDDTLSDNDEVLGADLRPPTSPILADSDGDGLSDLIETNTGILASATDTGTNPQDPDTDSDGTSDGDELSGENPGGFTSNPNLVDSDGDNYSDTTEYQLGTDPSDATSFPTSIYIGDAAPETIAVTDSGAVDSANVGNLTYALQGSPYTNTSGGPEEFEISGVNFWADVAGDVTPFVVLYNGNGVGPAANYTMLAIGDVLAAVGGTTNNAEFKVAGETASITVEDGETILAGFHQSLGVVPFGQPADADADYLDTENQIGALGGPFLEDATWDNLARTYSFNISLEPSSTVPFAIVDVDVDTVLRSATVTWNSRPGVVYAVWASDDLQIWAELDDSIQGVAGGTTTSFTESPIPANTARRYYQIRRP